MRSPRLRLRLALLERAAEGDNEADGPFSAAWALAGQGGGAVGGRVGEVDADPQGAEPVGAGQRLQLELLDAGRDLSPRLEVLEVLAVLGGLLGLRVDDGDGAGLG